MPTSKAKRAEVAERRERAVQMYITGSTWQHIADACGYASRGAACKDITRLLEVRQAKLDQTLAVARVVALKRLDALEREVWAVLRRPHLTVQQGRVVYVPAHDSDGKPILNTAREPIMVPLPDDGPILEAVDRLIKIGARRDRLTRIDTSPPPAQVNNVLVVQPGKQRDADQQLILDTLARLAVKSQVIDGELADAGTDLAVLTGRVTPDDRPPPPPIATSNGNGHKPNPKGSP